ncbi:MAG: hypothetical protein R3E42_14005 [Burkholderiaceae bacterium]
MSDANPTEAQTPSSVSSIIGQALVPLIAKVPDSKEPPSDTPGKDARQKANAAAAKAAITAGTLALPPGAVGWLTILPEMVGFGRSRNNWRLTSPRSTARPTL